MSSKVINRALLASAAAAMALAPLAAGAAQAQGYPPPSGDYRAAPDGYPDQPDADYDDDLPPPPGYDGRDMPPPPPGYEPDPDEAQWRDRDSQYGRHSENWARNNCVKSVGNTAAGAVIGGVIGAIVGSSLGGRHDHGGSTIAGAGIGAVGGAVIASGSGGDTSPGCPPGYVLRRDAREYAAPSGYDYAAPGWYRPWLLIGGAWVYRPYPYHAYYTRHYHRPAYYGGYRPYYRGDRWGGYGRGRGERHGRHRGY